MPIHVPDNFEAAWPWMRNFRRILKTVAEPRLCGCDLFIASDFSGSHSESAYNVYSFVAIDPQRSPEWPGRMQQVRRRFLGERRMSFKALNDARRQQALGPFLEAAEFLNGVCCSVAVTKNFQRMASTSSTLDLLSSGSILSGKWKDKILENALRVILMWSLVVSEVGDGQQHVTWLVDEDEIAANDLRHTDLLQLTGRIGQYFIKRPMGQLCVCTTATEGQNILFEDFAAVADLAAGAYCEVANRWVRGEETNGTDDGRFELETQTRKCDLISDWFFFPSTGLRRVAILIDREPTGGRSIKRITHRPPGAAEYQLPI